MANTTEEGRMRLFRGESPIRQQLARKSHRDGTQREWNYGSTPFWPMEFARFGMDGGKLFYALVEPEWLSQNCIGYDGSKISVARVRSRPPEEREVTPVELENLLRLYEPKVGDEGEFAQSQTNYGAIEGDFSNQVPSEHRWPYLHARINELFPLDDSRN
jgi:hypothetical protein